LFIRPCRRRARIEPQKRASIVSDTQNDLRRFRTRVPASLKQRHYQICASKLSFCAELTTWPNLVALASVAFAPAFGRGSAGRIAIHSNRQWVTRTERLMPVERDGGAMEQRHKPYRNNVGVALFNREGLVFAGRSRSDGPEIVLSGYEWQMPQGGIDENENIVEAARRELFEETNIQSIELLSVSAQAWTYDFPPYAGPPHHLCAFRGQSQRWIAFRFVGKEDEIDVLTPKGGQPAEFSAWCWLPLADLVERVVPFKRPVYERVAFAFAHLASVRAGR
jgi:putative (di)nucleoside polyphosphate hydrolase